jgi:hypothetical protein
MATADTERQLREWVTQYGTRRATLGHPGVTVDGARAVRYLVVLDEDLLDRDGPAAALDNGAVVTLDLPDPDGTLRQRAQAGIAAAIDQATAAGRELRVTLEDLVDGADRPPASAPFDPWAVSPD